MTAYSISEIAAQVKKAAHGSGLDWGRAEEAGWAAGWLSSHGAPGAQVFCRFLHARDGNWDRHQAACPLIQGIRISDTGVSRLTWTALGDLRVLVPFAARLGPHKLTWEGGECRVGPEGIMNLPDTAQTTGALRLSPCEDPPTTALQSAAQVPDKCWSRLGALAHRTYAPNTEESRRAGAGGADD